MCNVKVKAQEEFTLSVDTNEEYIWEVTELDLPEFKRIIGFEPNFELGDRIRLIIRDIIEGATGWSITVEFWDYKMDWGQVGNIEDLPMKNDPEAYSDYIFILTPIEDYLSSVDELQGPEYTVTSNSISKVIRADTGRDYITEKVYDRRGVPISETFYEYTTRRVLARVESGLTSISFGFYFLGFIAVAFTAIILITMKRKRFIFSNRN